MVNSSLFRRIQLQLLMNLTARALGERPVRIWTHSNGEALKIYAVFTAQHLRTGADEVRLQCMNNEALKMGCLLRRLFFIRSTAQAQRLIVALYRNIGIQLSFAADGQLLFHRCYFSSHYTPAACRAASMLDDGIIRGITEQSAGRLCFSQRITENCRFCEASLYDITNTLNRHMKKKAIVIGSGAGGAMAAHMLAQDFDVTVLEAGRAFKPLALPLEKLALLRPTGIYLDERMIQLLLPSMRIDRHPEMVMVYGRGVGGTTTLATGNAVRADEGLKRLGINLDEEFSELQHELPITTDHQRFWSPVTKQTFDVMREMRLDPQPMPKLLRPKQCRMCGHCSIGCPTSAKWDTRELLEGIRVITGCKVTRIDMTDREARMVHATKGWQHLEFEADIIIVAAGGYGTPDILRASGISCQPRLFVDPVLCVAAPMAKVHQDRQLLMPFVSRREKYIISPYMDWLSFFFNRSWRKPMDGMLSLMIKLADVEQGDVHHNKMRKTLTPLDNQRLQQGVSDCREVLMRMGADEHDIFLGTLNAGHPGGMLPLTQAEANTLHSPLLPDNLYVCDATILPQSLGLPPMLTIMALAKRIARNIIIEKG